VREVARIFSSPASPGSITKENEPVGQFVAAAKVKEVDEFEIPLVMVVGVAAPRYSRLAILTYYLS
jgi:hypothetical protein